MQPGMVKKKKPESTFDFTVHERDRKSGAIVRVNPYRLVVKKDGPSTLERDGVLYEPSGKRIGPVTGEALQKTPRPYQRYQNEAELRAAAEADAREKVAADRQALDAERAAIEAEKAQLAQAQAALAKRQEQKPVPPPPAQGGQA